MRKRGASVAAGLHSRSRFIVHWSFNVLLLTALAPSALAQPGSCLVEAARKQVGVTKLYDSRYVVLDYPGGDVPPERGVCTDVIVRAYRDAFGIDLQALVNADMRAHFARYPTRWSLKTPDANIDHRRVPNLRAFFARQGGEQPIPGTLDGWRPGDLVTQELSPPGVARSAPPHIGIVGNALAPGTQRRLVIHNIGAGTREEDVLGSWRITGRYRWPPPGRAG